jgi:hypothetical protein
MSTPQGPHDQPADQPAWGQQPPGGWGQPQQGQEWDPEQTRAVPPPGAPGQGQQGGQQQHAWEQQGPYGAPQPYGGQPQYGGQPHHGGQPQSGGQPHHGGQSQYDPNQYGQAGYGQQPTPQYPGQQQAWGRPGQQQGWGQNPGQQPTQQWQPHGAQQWGQGYPALPETPAGRRTASKLPLILGGVVVLVLAAVAVLGFVAPGFFVTKVFDAAAVQDGVRRILTDDYGIAAVTSVTCGEGIQVDTGATFECDATIDGAPVKVPIKVTSDDGAYEVGRPA